MSRGPTFLAFLLMAPLSVGAQSQADLDGVIDGALRATPFDVYCLPSASCSRLLVDSRIRSLDAPHVFGPLWPVQVVASNQIVLLPHGRRAIVRPLLGDTLPRDSASVLIGVVDLAKTGVTDTTKVVVELFTPRGSQFAAVIQVIRQGSRWLPTLLSVQQP